MIFGVFQRELRDQSLLNFEKLIIVLYRGLQTESLKPDQIIFMIVTLGAIYNGPVRWKASEEHRDLTVASHYRLCRLD